MKKILFLLLVVNMTVFAQNGKMKLGDAIVVEATGTVLIPEMSEEDIFSKALFGAHYTNILVTNSKNKGSIKLFDRNVNVFPFKPNGESNNENKNRSFSSKWIFLLVQDVDLNGNGKISDVDPVSLFVTDLEGKELKRLTNKTLKVKNFYVSEKNGFILVKIQSDTNGDNKLTSKDRCYFSMYDFNTLKHIKDIK